LSNLSASAGGVRNRQKIFLTTGPRRSANENDGKNNKYDVKSKKDKTPNQKNPPGNSEK